VNPKVVIHLTIPPDLKQFLIDNNINASELLEKAIAELMDLTNNEKKEDIMEYYEDIKKDLESRNIFTHPIEFDNKARYREEQIHAMNLLRHQLGFSYEDAKKLLEKYIEDKKQEIMENKEKFASYYDYTEY